MHFLRKPLWIAGLNETGKPYYNIAAEKNISCGLKKPARRYSNYIISGHICKISTNNNKSDNLSYLLVNINILASKQKSPAPKLKALASQQKIFFNANLL